MKKIINVFILMLASTFVSAAVVDINGDNFSFELNDTELPFNYNITYNITYNVTDNTTYDILYGDYLSGLSSFIVTNATNQTQLNFSLLLPNSSVLDTNLSSLITIATNGSSVALLNFTFLVHNTTQEVTIFPSYTVTADGNLFLYTIYDVELPFTDSKQIKVTSGINDTVNFNCGGLLSCINNITMTSAEYFLNVTLHIPTGTGLNTYLDKVYINNSNSSHTIDFQYEIKDTPVLLYNVTTPVTKDVEDFNASDFVNLFEALGELSEQRILEILEAEQQNTVYVDNAVPVPYPVLFNQTETRRLDNVDKNYGDVLDRLESNEQETDERLTHLEVLAAQIENNTRVNTTQIEEDTRQETLDIVNAEKTKDNRSWRIFGKIMIWFTIIGGVVYVYKKKITNF